MEVENMDQLSRLIRELERQGFQLQGTSFLVDQVTLHLRAAPWIDIRKMVQLVNIFGDRQPLANESYQDYRLQWYIAPDSVSESLGYFTLTFLHASTGYWLDEELKVLLQLFTLSQEPVELTKTFPIDGSHLLHHYASIQEVLREYVAWVDYVQTDKLLERQDTCSFELYPYGACCEQHRMMVAQRLVFRDWLTLFLRDRSHLKTTPLQDAQDYTVLSHEEMVAALSRTSQQYPSVEAFLNAQHEYYETICDHGWGLPRAACIHNEYTSYHCCAHHLFMKAMGHLYATWSVMLHHRYGINQRASLSDHSTLNVGCRTWQEVLIALSGTDRTQVQFLDPLGMSLEELLRDYGL